jgi:hypothetical protein
VTHRPFPVRGMTVVLMLLAAAPGHAQPPAPGGDEWKYDIVYRKKGEPFKGLVLADKKTDPYVYMTIISRKPNRPTIQIKFEIPRHEVERVELLDPKDRDVLIKRLDALQKERDLLAARLRLLEPGAKPASDADVLTLNAVPWPPEPGKKALSYASTHFCLVSSARNELAQLAAIQLEHVYNAYAGVLPPRVENAAPTTILLTASFAEYQALVRAQGGNLLNSAFFDPDRNQVVCGSDLQRLCDQMEKIREFHAKRRKELADEEAELKTAYKNKVPAALLDAIKEERARIDQAEKRNTAGYHTERDRLFCRLYHEAFHAYLNTFVYPPDRGELPRWFNEGLAQIFEAAVFEADGLRLYAAPAQVDALRLAIKNETLPSVAEVLRSGPRQFVVAHTSEKQKADRYYLASWGLAYYLNFDRHVLGTKAMDEYVATLKRGTDPVEAFTTLVGQPLPEFQKKFSAYLNTIRADDSR